jgi:hypothetical protein
MAAGCGGEAAGPNLPAAPEPVLTKDSETPGGVTAQNQGNSPPNAVFRTQPREIYEGELGGTAPLEVTFNTCRSTDPDPGDQLRYTFDFDADGVNNFQGTCRGTHTYVYPQSAIICVDDRQPFPGHKICKKYQIYVRPGPPVQAPPPRIVVSNGTPGSVDNSVDTRTVDVTTAQAPAGAKITDVNITVDFEKDGDDDCGIPDTQYSYPDEISMALMSPGATTVNLVFDTTPGPPSYTTAFVDAPPVVVTFDDAAASLVGTTNGGIPESGTFRPVEPLSAFNGEGLHGTWTFRFGDEYPSDFLCFNSFDLEITFEE